MRIIPSLSYNAVKLASVAIKISQAHFSWQILVMMPASGQPKIPCRAIAFLALRHELSSVNGREIIMSLSATDDYRLGVILQHHD